MLMLKGIIVIAAAAVVAMIGGRYTLLAVVCGIIVGVVVMGMLELALWCWEKAHPPESRG